MFAKAKFLRVANEKKWEAVYKFSTQVEMTHEPEFTTADLVILKVVKKRKISLLEKRIFFCFGKILLTQTSNLTICLGIYVDNGRRELQGFRFPYTNFGLECFSLRL